MPTPDPRSPERIHAVLQQFRVLLRSIKRHYKSVEQRTTMGGSQVWALAEIGANPDISVGDLARRLAIHLSTASNLVGRMETLGVITRERVRQDQRVVRLRITEAGRAALRRAPGPPVGLLQQALLDLPPARLTALRRELDALLGQMKRRDARAHAALLADLWPSADDAAPVPRPAAKGRKAAKR
ncbi:MAG: MarR family transcriptional regulator [Betaproteobacteria bacterium]|nr:MarR family transcriptional regulator [Betaproteobacteria bacterium]